jgi:hypothetical protein
MGSLSAPAILNLFSFDTAKVGTGVPAVNPTAYWLRMLVAG